MDGTRFDLMARALGTTSTRRSGVAAVLAGLIGATATDATASASRRRDVCRPTGVGCTRGDQCCSSVCDTRRTAPRAVRNRCACPVGQSTCATACCGDGETCSDGTCLCGEGVCFIGARGNAIPRADDTCYHTNHAALCLTNSDCACPSGSTCFCAKGLSGDDAIVESWIASVCVTATPRPVDNFGCCPTEDYCDLYYGGMACIEVRGDDLFNCGACGQTCLPARTCEAGSCACNEEWCDHYCAQESAEWLCAELQDGTIIEACADGYTALTGKACESDDDCDGDEPNVPTIGGGCIKHAFILHSPRSYLSQAADSGFCAWFTLYGANSCA
jgi:hypothetical protein